MIQNALQTPETESVQKALIYCRVSHSKQKTQGSGLDSQEHRCRQYAAAQGYEVVRVFPDDVSGGGDFMKRKGMKALLDYLAVHPNENYVVIFDDLKRFARDTIFHFKLKHTLKIYDAVPECLSFKFEDTPEGEFVETVFAAQGQLERLQNRRQTLQKMTARLERGYWVFQAPIGYEYSKTAEHGKLLTRKEPYASIIKEALEGFASGRFQTQAEVKYFFESFPHFPRDRYGEVRNQRVTEILTRAVYAGYVYSENWDIPLRKGHHEGLISLETFNRIQQRLNEKARAPNRIDLTEDFPLRGFILCGDCDKPLTACWSKSSTGKKHPYYLCHNKSCDSHRKSIRRNEVEIAFAGLLTQLQPTHGLFSIASKMFKDLWNHKLSQAQNNVESIQHEIVTTQKQIDKLLDRIVEAETPSVISAYEKRIQKLEQYKMELTEKSQTSMAPTYTFEQMFERAMTFLASPCKIWENGNLTLKRQVLRLAFSENLAYQRGKGLRTPKTSAPFQLIQRLSERVKDNFESKSKMAHRGDL